VRRAVERVVTRRGASSKLAEHWMSDPRRTDRPSAFCSTRVAGDRWGGVFRRLFRRPSTRTDRSVPVPQTYPVRVMRPIASFPLQREDVMRTGDRRTWTLWLTCDDCGDIELNATRAVLRYGQDTGAFTITYQCPMCGRRECLDVVDGAVLGSLFSAGMLPVPWSIVPEDVPDLPPLTVDEIDAIACLLDAPGWVEEHERPA
jgi:hypothetical protein